MTANVIVVEHGGREKHVTLSKPMSIGELWGFFAMRGKRPTAIFMAKMVARVIF
jgi:hypothetical protein